MIKPGYVFICRKGIEKDGCDFAQSAVAKGAVAVVSPRPLELLVPVIITEDIEEIQGQIAKRFYFPQKKKFRLIGVTGTNGKTTVTHLIKDILENSGSCVGVIGTNGIFIDNRELPLYKSTPTTPNAIELWQIFRRLEDNGAEYVVMEVSSHALALERVWGCEFDIGVFTNLTRDHLDFHKTMEEYKKAKAKLFNISRKAVINIDDVAGAEFYGSFKGEKLSVGLGDAELTPAFSKMSEMGSEFSLEYTNRYERVSLALPGRFNIYNALLAAGTTIMLGLDLTETARGLSKALPVAGRMERVYSGDFTVIVDYAHSPDGLEKLIHTAKGFAGGRVITVFGCGGNRDREKRAIMGEISGKYSDYTVVTSDNPRCEDEFEIISDIYRGIKNTKGSYIIVPDREMAIGHAISLARKGDIILLAGKGNEDYQVIGKDKVKFDEREIVRKFLQKG